jgi:hypothetical protein
MKVRSLFSLRGRSVILAGMMLAATVIAPLAANAYYYMGYPNGKHAYSGGLLNLWYSRNCSGSFYGAAGDAAYGWNVTPTPVWWNEGSVNKCDGGVWNGWVDTYSYNNASDWAWGWAQAYALDTICDFYLWPFGCISSHQQLDPRWDETYVAGTIEVNVAKNNGSDYFLLVGDVTHEMGHNLGLAHAGAYCGCGDPYSYYSIMDYLNWSYNRPQSYDINAINYLY